MKSMTYWYVATVYLVGFVDRFWSNPTQYFQHEDDGLLV